jgi:SAM-dependent methyltransferase
MATKSYGEYAQKGEYHVTLDPNWPYLPVYLTKMERIEALMRPISKDAKILDVGCGEGVLVNRLRDQGYANIRGIDLNYESENVDRGSALSMPYAAETFEVMLCLDMIEHLNVLDQEPLLDELHDKLVGGGELIISIPNLAHLASRLSFLTRGQLIRTSSIDRHPGDRPIGEFTKLLKARFEIIERHGLFPTFPLLSALTLKLPSKVVWMHRLYNALLGQPSLCMLNIFRCRKN